MAAARRNPGKNPHASALGKLGAAKGGRARAASTTEFERKQIARKGAAARWKHDSQTAGLRVLNLNCAGAKFLDSTKAERAAQQSKLNAALEVLAEQYRPDVMVLQEVARYGSADRPDDLIRPPSGYSYQSFVAIDSSTHRHPARFSRMRAGGNWRLDEYLAQGCGLLWRSSIKTASVWNFEFETRAQVDAETVRLERGLYTGSRDTEPRLAVVSHFLKDPIEFFVVNLHLVTFRGEREGVPAKDARGSQARLHQLDTILNGIVSEYNEWRSEFAPERLQQHPPPVWILAGDFNCSPGSPEIARVQQLNFVDLNPLKGPGTKAPGIGRDPTITLDYIFAGPEYVAFDPFLARQLAGSNPTPIVNATTRGVSDHYPLVADVPFF
jgi:endonuclease/exonuclease/phosphatase family metal-dependent hydrolase